MALLWRCIHTITDIINRGYHSFRFSPDGKTLFFGNRMWDVNTGKLKTTAIETQQGILNIDGKTLVTCGTDGQTLQLWDVETGELTKTFTQNSSRITFVAISPDGQTLVTHDAELAIKLWNVSTGEPTHTLARDITQFYAPFPAVFSPNGQIIAVVINYKPHRAWDVNSGRQIGNSYNNRIAGSIAFTPDGKILFIEKFIKVERHEVYSAGGSDWYDVEHHSSQIRDWETDRIIQTLGAHEFLSLSPDGQIAIKKQRQYWAGEIHKYIHFTNLNGGKTINPIAGGTNAAFSPLGNIVAVVKDDGQSLTLLNCPSGREITTIPGYISAFGFSPDEKTLAIMGHNSIKLWHQSTTPIVNQSLHGNAYPHLAKLENLLAADLWEDADKETAAIIKVFPARDVNLIDQLWLHYSMRNYGFSVQKEIWRLSNPRKGYQDFALSVGWGTMQTNHMYHGENDEFFKEAWNKTHKGYYPRQCYPPGGLSQPSEIWSHLKG